MDTQEFSYLRKPSYTSLDNLRSILGILLGLFLVLWIRNPMDDANLSDTSRQTQSLLAALIAFYFIFDFYLFRSLSDSLYNRDDILKYPVHFRICVAIQFILLVVVVLVASSLIGNDESPIRETTMKKMCVVFLCLYLYKLFSVFYVYRVILQSYEVYRINTESGIEDKDSLSETKPQEV